MRTKLAPTCTKIVAYYEENLFEIVGKNKEKNTKINRSDFIIENISRSLFHDFGNDHGVIFKIYVIYSKTCTPKIKVTVKQHL